MQILLTNDDGIFAPGLAALYRELVKMGDVTVVAPSASRSGAGVLSGTSLIVVLTACGIISIAG